ncbi:DUF4221 family protein [Salegentibacter sp. Hel_I_6]|uniref:DUF4221 family protein n=1 Tax=Salegentibacter sp. Hel_I_6 TaxID=1250278 RepID=UPI00055A001A|nr:DUF4221 family protein [Salegentibacter sp. Hel_I_6]
MKRFISICIITFISVSCNENRKTIVNEKKGELHPTMELQQVASKSFLLDDETAPKPLYVEIFKDSSNVRLLTFLNNYNNSIYFYDFNKLNFIKKLSLDKEGPNGINMPMGFHIKEQDSIYIYHNLFEVALLNKSGEVQNRISLNGGHDIRRNDISWAYVYPEFSVQTVIPFMERSNELLLSGYFSGSMPDSIVDKFNFLARMDYDLNEINYSHSYPSSLFGENVNWGEGLFKEVFPELHPDGNKLIYSFPISHDLYITELNGQNYEKIYAGSKSAGTIKSINKKPGKASAQEIRSSFVRQDMYAAILYDKFRKVYYRFLRKALPDAPKHTSWKEKNIAIIILDQDFKYLGETTLGPETIWHWQNSFVTEEGLNIEYLDENNINEVNLTFKIFTPKKL